jgi:F0F1-type ATP synthase assembly protein I
MDECVSVVRSFYTGGSVGKHMLGRVLGSILREFKIPHTLVAVVLARAGVQNKEEFVAIMEVYISTLETTVLSPLLTSEVCSPRPLGSGCPIR